MNNFTINHVTGEIVITKAFNKKASNTQSNEYRLLRDTRKDFPDYKIVLRTANVSANKKTYPSLNYTRMEEYIREECKSKGLGEKETEAKVNEFKTIKALANRKPGSYAYTKEWFFANYPDYKNGFIDKDKKKEADETNTKSEENEKKEVA